MSGIVNPQHLHSSPPSSSSASSTPTNPLSTPKRPSPLRQAYLPAAARHSALPFQTRRADLSFRSEAHYGRFWGWRAVSARNEALLSGPPESLAGVKRSLGSDFKISFEDAFEEEGEDVMETLLDDASDEEEEDVEIVMGAFSSLGLGSVTPR